MDTASLVSMTFGGGAKVVSSSEGLNMVELPDNTGFADVTLPQGVVSPHVLLVLKLSNRLASAHLDPHAVWFRDARNGYNLGSYNRQQAIFSGMAAPMSFITTAGQCKGAVDLISYEEVHVIEVYFNSSGVGWISVDGAKKTTLEMANGDSTAPNLQQVNIGRSYNSNHWTTVTFGELQIFKTPLGEDASQAKVWSLMSKWFPWRNVALHRPSQAKSTLWDYGAVHHPIAAPVDGAFSNFYHSNLEDYPWWSVDLGRDLPIALVRVTNRKSCCGGWLDGFTIYVGDSVCGQGLVVPQGLTGDFTCSSALIGSTVRIELPQKRRSLNLVEVEVFSNSGLEITTGCYASGYPDMKACAPGLCTGPGPTQCTGCQASEAFVPWRKLSQGITGSCHEFTNQAQFVNVPGQAAPDSADQFFTKWALTTEAKFGSWVPSDFEVTGETGVEIFPTCRQSKTVSCGPKTISTGRVCNVTKSSHLVEAKVTIAEKPWMEQRCRLDGGIPNSPLYSGAPIYSTGGGGSFHNWCLKVPAAKLQAFGWTNLTNINQLCQTLVTLL